MEISDEIEPIGPTITLSESKEVFWISLAWLEQQTEATPMKSNTSTARIHWLYSRNIIP